MRIKNDLFVFERWEITWQIEKKYADLIGLQCWLVNVKNVDWN